MIKSLFLSINCTIKLNFMERKVFAVILAGGSGSRMGSDLPKQFIEIDGKPILRHTIEAFQSLPIPVEIIVVLPSTQKSYWKNYCKETGFLTKYILPTGGITRFHSVQNALKYVPDGALVMVHDGVRPFITTDFLMSLIEKGREFEAVVPVRPCIESLRRVEGDESCAIDRSGYVSVQTPQVFHSEVINKAYSQSYNPSFTDDASVVEAAGYKITLCDGLRQNIKITTPEDLEVVNGKIFQLN